MLSWAARDEPSLIGSEFAKKTNPMYLYGYSLNVSLKKLLVRWELNPGWRDLRLIRQF